MLHSIMQKFFDFKVLQIGQNLHANMEGFHRADVSRFLYIKCNIKYISYTYTHISMLAL